METIKKGSVQDIVQLKPISSYFAPLETIRREGERLAYVIVHNRIQHSVDAVITGRAEEDSVRNFVQHHSLKPIEKPEAFRKILPLTRRWNLRQEFRTDFAPPDLVFLGRPKDRSKAVIQIAWRKSDLRFTAEMMGSIKTDDSASESAPN